MTIARILVGLDGSALAEQVLPVVRTLAAPLGAEVTLLHVAHVPESFRAADEEVTLDGILARERHEAESYLRRLAHELEGAGLTVRTSVTVGDTVDEIVDGAEREHVDLLALATHGRSGLRRWLHGSVADAVLHGTTKPLLLVRPADNAPPVDDVRRLIVPLDGSVLAEEVLPMARELAQRLEVPIELLRVVEPMGLAFAADPYGGVLVDYSRILKELEAGATAYLEEVADRERRAGVTVGVMSTTGVIADTITRHQAARPGSLVVLGSHGRTGWRAAVLGSVARRVVALAEGPVMILRPKAAHGR
jgi:nucleotide-binding universal stress UspA family protein